jgi:hypothetical protein
MGYLDYDEQYGDVGRAGGEGDEGSVDRNKREYLKR